MSTSSAAPDGFDERWAVWMARGRTQNVATRRRMAWVGAVIAGAFVCWWTFGALGG